MDNRNALLTLFLILGICIKENSSLGVFEPENHILSGLNDEKVSVKLVLDRASDIRSRILSRPVRYLAKRSGYTPIVFYHGMGDTAYGSINTDRLALQKKFPGLVVYSIMIGNSTFDDEMGGYFTNVNEQINQACEQILQNRDIISIGAFNAVGFSQGSQFMRGLIQRCPLRENGIRVKNFISLGGQHQGVFGLPHCTGNINVCSHIRWLLTEAAYESTVQEHCVQAEYWHDPLQEQVYKEKSVFLADINNEIKMNQTYKKNLLQLDNLVLVQFTEDEMVVPRESSLFGFYTPGQSKEIQPMQETSLYLEDRIGLRELNESGRLHLIKVAGGHLRYNMSWFLDEIASIYLNN